MVSLRHSEDSLPRLNPNLSLLFPCSLCCLVTSLTERNGPSSSGFCLFYSSWCWCEIPNSLQPAAFLSPDREGLVLVLLLTFSFSNSEALSHYYYSKKSSCPRNPPKPLINCRVTPHLPGEHSWERLSRRNISRCVHTEKSSFYYHAWLREFLDREF